MNIVRAADGKKIPIADNWEPCDLHCPIDGTQLAYYPDVTGDGAKYYPCVICKAMYSVRSGQISEDDLPKQARIYLDRTKRRLKEVNEEKSRLLKILELAKQNNFS